MIDLLKIISGLSFIGYSLSYLFKPSMREEFKKLQIQKFSLLVVTLEFLGGVGLLVGIYSKEIALLSSGGLSLMMFLAVSIRIYYLNHWKFMLQGVIFFIINGIIFFKTLNLF